ncbi:DMT family transporter [Ureibacillus thermophilus]|uniref:Multidrug efflux SMR transporter n=2 Tax=Ureibacillus TaxID=160795 RepID=A0A4P6UQE4_9BACL|nr:SMR family transporter [Ureibacillus thermophilus]MBO2506399.1 QacE family quaternary ammonium compound efflux SMR transporter [Bacilli bacterium]QBK24655.1 multidrug efflux SMR transporter [Ureibacillus thermophilus]
MNKHWMTVYVAALFEVLWVIGLAHADRFLEWAGTVCAIFLSNYLLIRASQFLPAGTVYSVFVGLGSLGAVISDIVFFGEPFHLLKICFILFIIAGVVGLQLLTDEDAGKGDEE